MKKALLFCMLLCTIHISKAQTGTIDHWETIFSEEQDAKYIQGNDTIPADWNTLSFNDESWSDSDYSIIGYGTAIDVIFDNSVNYNLTESATFYTRTSFEVSDSSTIEQLMLTIIHEDAFVAYLNGKEICRSNIGTAGEATSYDQYADTTHLFQIYSMENPAGILIDKSVFSDVLVNGENVLALEVHNDEYNTTSHYYIALLTVGINDKSTQFDPYIFFLPQPVPVDSSNLPIVLIDIPETTFIPDEPKITASMKIIDNPNSEYNKMSDTTYNYNGAIGIEIRGSSSMYFYPKKSYGLETRNSLGENNNVELVGMPRENDWILYAPYGDKTLIRNVLTYKIARDLGHYAPRTKYVDLIRNGENKGLYVMMEKIKRDNDRIDIARLRVDELAGDSLTGGYIIKIDKTEPNDVFDGWHSEFGSAENENKKTYYQYVYPKYDEIKEAQESYIQSFMHQFELSLRADNFDDIDNGYRKFINTETFVDYFIINELSKNMDAYRLSTYMYKDRDDNDGRLHIGPVWDYNLAFGNYESFGGKEPEGWVIDFGSINPSDNYQIPFWWDRLFQDEQFAQQVKDRWEELRETQLSISSLYSDIDSLTNHISDSKDRNYEVWKGVFDSPVWPNQPLADSYEGEVTYMKDWLSDRLDWLDANMGATREKKYYVSIESNYANEYIGIGAYPNPFSNELTFTIDLESDHSLQVDIYNVSGQLVYTHSNTYYSAGHHSIEWNGESTNGGFIGAGMYIYQVIVDGKLIKTDKLLKQ